jgi:ureidoacrylate peracid hydrolase
VKTGRTRAIILTAITCLVFSSASQSEKNVNGVEVLTSIEEFVNPSSSAVIVIDMQNEIVSTEGGYGRSDKAAPANPKNHQILPRFVQQVSKLRTFLDAARQAGVMVGYAEYIHQDRYGKMVVNGPEVWMHRNSSFVSKAVEGTWESKTVDELAPKQGEILIRKSRADAFYATYLDDLLKDKQIKTVLLTGTGTGGCVFATAMGAMERGYYPVIVRDAVDQDQQALGFMKGRFPIYDSDEIIAVWKRLSGSHT